MRKRLHHLPSPTCPHAHMPTCMISRSLKFRSNAKAAALSLFILCSTHAAFANPSVRLVVPYPSGGFADRIARAIAVHIAPRLGTAVYVENVTGAGGMRGSLEVARATPDGLTLLLTSPPNLAIAKALSPALPIDPVASFSPIAHIGGPPFVLVSSASRLPPAKLSDLAESASLATYGSPGFGTMGHILCAAISEGIRLPLLHVPYSKSMLPDLLAGHIDLGCISLSTVQSSIANRQLFPLVITGSVRRPELPGIPTLTELGQKIPGVAWLAVVAPAGLAAATAAKLNALFISVLANPSLADILKLELAEPLPLSSDELAILIQTEADIWPPIILRLLLRR